MGEGEEGEVSGREKGGEGRGGEEGVRKTFQPHPSKSPTPASWETPAQRAERRQCVDR